MAYGQSKLANLLFMAELDRKARSAGVANRFQSVAAHPVTHRRTSRLAGPGDGGQQADDIDDGCHQPCDRPAGEAGCGTDAVCRDHAHVQGGEYYGPNGLGEMRGYPKKVQPNGRAKNEADAARLWDLSEQATGVSYDWSMVR